MQLFVLQIANVSKREYEKALRSSVTDLAQRSIEAVDLAREPTIGT